MFPGNRVSLVEKVQHSNTDGKLADHIVILAQEAEKVKTGSRVRL